MVGEDGGGRWWVFSMIVFGRKGLLFIWGRPSWLLVGDGSFRLQCDKGEERTSTFVSNRVYIYINNNLLVCNRHFSYLERWRSRGTLSLSGVISL